MSLGNFDDGFFSIDSVNGFLPKVDPLDKLPAEYLILQNLLDDIPMYTTTKDIDGLELAVRNLPNYLNEIKQIENSNILLIHALRRGYAILTSAYLLHPSHVNQVDGNYGKARQILPANITQPFEYVSDKLKAFPFLDYHWDYSSGNYVKINPTLPENEVYKYTNLKLAVSFSGTKDEEGFIMLHVDIVSKTKKLIKGLEQYISGDKLVGLTTVLEASKEINDRRKEMWSASNHKNYNAFRAFIMGIHGNVEIFGDGVIYEGSENTEKRTYRGQTGAQDDTIPTLDIFTGVINYYPENELTKYLLDLRQYRPIVFQDFFKKMESMTIDYLTLNVEELKMLYLIVDEIWKFRNGHWQFVQKYILANTKYAVATGGTPITTWLPNQIGAVLEYMTVIIDRIKILDDTQNFNEEYLPKLNAKKEILSKQQEELLKTSYEAEEVYKIGEQFNDLTNKRNCPFHH